MHEKLVHNFSFFCDKHVVDTASIDLVVLGVACDGDEITYATLFCLRLAKLKRWSVLRVHCETSLRLQHSPLWQPCSESERTMLYYIATGYLSQAIHDHNHYSGFHFGSITNNKIK